MTTHDVLKKVEWQESELGPRCPLCRAYQPRGHREGCEMQAALDRESPAVQKWLADCAGIITKKMHADGTLPQNASVRLSFKGPLVGAQKLIVLDEIADRLGRDEAARIDGEVAALVAAGIPPALVAGPFGSPLRVIDARTLTDAPAVDVVVPEE